MKKNNILAIIIFSAALLLAPVFFAQAANYYVSPSSVSVNWSAAKSSSTPCTVATAFTNAVAGDTVYFRGGTYNVPAKNFSDSYHGYYEPANAGVAGSPIIFMAYPSETPLFNGTAGGSGDQTEGSSGAYATIFGTNNKSYIIFDGFTFQSDGGTKMARIIVGHDWSDSEGEGHCIVRNCTFNGGTTVLNSTDNNEGLRIEGQIDTKILNCKLYNYRSVGDYHNTSAIKMYSNVGTIIENSEIYNTSVAIFDKGQGTNDTYRYNYIHDNAQALDITDYGWGSDPGPTGYFINDHINSQVYQNIFLNNANITMEDEAGAASSYLTIYNNSFYSGPGGHFSFDLGNGVGKLFYNNIIFGSRLDGDLGTLRFASQDTIAGVIPQVYLAIAGEDHNQWSFSASDFLTRIHHQDGPTWTDYTSLAAWQASTELAGGGHPGANDRTDANPGFISATPAQLSDFRLATSSPSKGAGRSGADMGANINWVGINAASPLSADTVPPSAPTKVRLFAAGANQINLTWNPSTDNTKVAGYVIFRDGLRVLDNTYDNNYADTQLLPSTSINYFVVAYDAAGNYSQPSATVALTTGSGSSDVTAPTVPSGFSAVTVSNSQINLSWSASSDAVGVAGYRIYRDGVQIATTTSLAYSNTGLSAATQYTYSVSAYDATYNYSAPSSSASATTLAAADTTAPTVPSGLTATLVSGREVDFYWTASTDAVGVAGYKIFRGGTQIATTTATNYADTSGNPATAYSYTVAAFDAARNVSAPGSALAETTGHEYYVAPTGNDSHAGSLASPWLTWNQAVNTAAAGDIVYFRSGTYPVTFNGTTYDAFGDGRTMHAGTAISPVTLKAYAGENPLITVDGYKRAVRVESSYWVFDSLQFIASNVIDHASGIIVIGEDLPADYTVIKNCSFHIASAAGQDNIASIQLDNSNSSYALIENNTFQGFNSTDTWLGSDGVQYLGGANVGTKILHNVFYDLNLGIYVKHSNADTALTGAEIAYNYVYNCHRSFYGEPFYINYHDNFISGCNMEFGDNGGGTQGTHNTFNHNTFYNAGLVLENPSEGPVTYSHITNNIFTGSFQPSLWGSGNLAPHYSTTDYNLYQAGSAAIIEYGNSYSLATWKTHYGEDAHSLAGSPTFTGGANPATTSISNFALTGGSLGKNAGSDGKDLGADFSLVGLQNASSSDTSAPTVPAGLSATAISSTRIDLSWNASTDNVGVTGYDVYRNGSYLTNTVNPNYSDNGLTASTQYTYTVSAYDAAGNQSAQSISASATTPAGGPDITAPTVPTGLTATAFSTTQINLSWTASTDNVGVVGYRVYRGGVQIATSTVTNYSNTGLSLNTNYTYTVSAYDAARNFSAQSTSASATTFSANQISLVAHTVAGGGSSGAGLTSSAINTTGATLLVVGLHVWTATSTLTVSDSLGNSWHHLRAYGASGTGGFAEIFYAYNPNTGPAQTFSVTGASNNYPALTVSAWSGTAITSAVLDQSNGRATTSSVNLKTGSVTPTKSGELIVSIYSNDTDNLANPRVNSSFTITNSEDTSGVSMVGSMAYLVATTTNSYNPTWTVNSSELDSSAAIATFKSAVDTTPPVISSIATSTSATTATIIWTTDENSTSTIKYGLTNAYGSASSSNALVISHSITLHGLSAGQTYHFQIGSTDSSGNRATSSDHLFIAQVSTHSLTYTAGANGSITGSSSQVVNNGGNGTAVTAVPATGYHFVNWSDASTANPRTDTNVLSNISVTANFAINTYTIFASSGANGTVTPTATTTKNYNTSQTYSIATSTAGYHIVSVLVDGSSVGAVATYTFSNITANHTISATFAINTYTITASAGANGTVTPTGVTTKNYNQSQAYTIATSTVGYHIVSVLVDGSSVGAVTTYTFSNITANHTISATFAINTYTITASAGTHGTVAPAGVTTKNYGQSQTYTIATSTPGYHVNAILVDLVSVGTSSTYTFTSISSNHTISATFSSSTISYALTYVAGANGSIAGVSPQTLSFGGNGSTVTAVPNIGYHFTSWSDGVLTAARTDLNVTHNISVTANFAINTYTIFASAGSNGTVTPAATTTKNYNTSQTYSIATSTAGYHIVSVLVDGSSVGAVATYTFSNIAANHTISASFAINSYTITASAGTHGTVTPAGVTTKNYNQSQAYVIATSTAGYHIVDVMIDGSSAGAISAYTFSNIISNHTISATFALTATSTTHTIGGTISGLSGTVVLQDNGGDNLSVAANGSFNFATAINNAASYAVTVLSNPSGQTCSVSSGAGTVAGADINGVSISCANNAVVTPPSSGGGGGGGGGGIVTDTNPPGSPTGFTASSYGDGIILSWVYPIDSDFAGIKLYRKTGLAASGQSDVSATLLYSGKAATFVDRNGIIPGVAYYYSLYSFDSQLNYSLPSIISYALPNVNATSTRIEPIVPSAAGGQSSAAGNNNPASGTVTTLIGATGATVNQVTADESQKLIAKNSYSPLTPAEVIIYKKIIALSASVLADVNKFAVADFIHSGTPTTIILGAGERGGSIASFHSAFSRLPDSILDWQDVVKIGNGRWTTQTSAAAIARAQVSFEKIYLRKPNMKQANDNAAVNIMAYGLRPAARNTKSEKIAILSFEYIFKKNPVSAADWDIVRAIAYSGAKR